MRKLTEGEKYRHHETMVRNLNAGYEAALEDVRDYLTMPDFDVSKWIDARLTLVRSQA